MKKYRITGVSGGAGSKMQFVVNGGKHFNVQKPKDGCLIPGDKIRIIYGDVLGYMPMAHIYNGNIIDMGVLAPCELMGGQYYIGMMKWYDRLIFNFVARKNIIANGKKPSVRAWRNAQILAGIGIKNWKQSQGL